MTPGEAEPGWVDDWYCLAWEAGLPFDSCSPENPIHGDPCGPWRRRATTTGWDAEMANAAT